jgi:hypothetical protein
MIASIEKTVVDLFQALERQGIRYAVLRNYEIFPSLRRANDSSPHTDIDLVVDSRDLAEFRTLMAAIAADHGWDALMECDHWTQSRIRHHNIEAFRLHRARPLEYLQVDVFHGLLLWGLPVYDERQMLEGRIYDTARSLARIAPVKENVYRLLQIHGLYPNAQPKRARYQEKALAFRVSNREIYDQNLAATFGRFGVRALEALSRGDIRQFIFNMRLGRTWFALRYAFHNPLRIFYYLGCRLRENIQRFYTRQCGFVLRVSAPDEARRQTLREVMDELVRNSFLEEWLECEAGTRRSFNDHVAMEQGAIIIEWNKADRADIDLRDYKDRSDVVEAILRAGARQHKPLYLRSGAAHRSTLEAAAG